MEIINENYKLYQGDCLEVMDRLIEEGIKVDAIITDPPYGTTGCKWDSVIPLDKMWERVNKLIKDNGAIVLFGSQPFTSVLISSNIKNYKHSWVWHKKNAGNMLNAKYQPLKTTEDIMVFTHKGERVNYYPILTSGHKNKYGKAGNKKTDLYSSFKTNEFIYGSNKKGDERYPKHLIEFSNASRKEHYHPTQKPVPLMEYLIKTYTKESELVLDFTMGSGSTGVACMNTNRKFIGIELDGKYFNIAVDRMNGNNTGNNNDESEKNKNQRTLF